MTDKYICNSSRLIVSEYHGDHKKHVRADVTEIIITDDEVIVKAKRRN